MVRLLGPVRTYVRSSTTQHHSKFADEDGIGEDPDTVHGGEEEEEEMVKDITHARTKILQALSGSVESAAAAPLQVHCVPRSRHGEPDGTRWLRRLFCCCAAAAPRLCWH